VIRSTAILPDMRRGFFACGQCGQTVLVENVKGVVAEPVVCPRAGCGARHTMTLEHNRSLYSDKQVVRLQETPDRVPDGQTPHVVTLCVYDGWVDAVRPGDRVTVTGLFRVAPIRLNQRQRRVKTLFRTYLDVVHLACEAYEDGKDNSETKDGVGTPGFHAWPRGEVLVFEELSRHRDLFSLLARSVAPSIWRQETAKKALVLQLFGGVAKQLARHGETAFRGDVHVLVAGDPSMSKSQLLQYAHALAPRGLYTSGKGTSAVGLTAYVVRDVETGSLVLESGALVLSDGGLCCIDEFDKMSDGVRAILHEVMAQQTLSISKAGIMATLQARTAVLAAANPIHSKYDPRLSILENLHLPPSLLSRFDLVCLLLDVPDERHDMLLARHLCNLHTRTSPSRIKESCHSGLHAESLLIREDTGAPEHKETAKGPILENDCVPVHLLRRYIAYARANVTPVLSEAAIRPLLEGYVAMRTVNNHEGQSRHAQDPGSGPQPYRGSSARGGPVTVSATTRQLESLIRLSEAHARMRLSTSVEPEDVHSAIDLIQAALLTYALDPRTGKIDMDLIATGKGAAFRANLVNLQKVLLAHLAARPANAPPPTLATLLRDLRSTEAYSMHADKQPAHTINSTTVTESLLKQAIMASVEDDLIRISGPSGTLGPSSTISLLKKSD
jgi:DNA replication licensing factor MCM4